MKKFCIAFAGVPGCGKSTLAHRLSWELGLPVFSNDMIRHEICIEQSGKLDIEAYNLRHGQYIDKLITKQRSFIYDASVDRRWTDLKRRSDKEGYDIFLVSFNLSPDFMHKLRANIDSPVSEDAMQVYFRQHAEFLEKYKEHVNMYITDQDFPERFDRAIAQLGKSLS